MQSESNLVLAGRIALVTEQVNDLVGCDHQGAPSLVDVLSKLAAHWAFCVCVKKIRQSGHKGWEKEGLRLGREIDWLNDHIPLIDSTSKQSAMQAELAILEAQSMALNEEWGQAFFEAVASEEQFLDARRFCAEECNIGDDELFNAALVRFRADLLKLGQGPSKRRLSKIESLLKNLHPKEWKTKTWASPTKPTKIDARRVTPEKLNSFIVQELRSEAVKPVVQSEWTTITEVADGLDENKGTVSRLIRQGRLRDNGLKKRERRIDPASVLEYCKAEGMAYNET